MKVSGWLISFVMLAFTIGLTPANAQQPMCAPVSNNLLVMENLCNETPRAEAVHAGQKVSASWPAQNLLTLTANEINSKKLNDPPMIRLGDVLVFEANRSDFILELYLANGKEIVTQPLTKTDAESTLVGWRKGRAKLDYLDSLNQYVVGMKVTSLHQTGTPLLLRGVKIDRKGRFILELEKTQPAQRQITPEPPMSYPPDPRIITAGMTMPSLRQGPPTGFMASHIPAFSMQPMILQSSGGTSGGPNHFKYAGQELDAESGLNHMGARYYSPALGRFTSPDPNQYARNNPLIYVDTNGNELAIASSLSKSDQQRVTKALVDVYRKPGGAARIENLVKSNIKYTVGTGDLQGEGYGLTTAKGKIDPATGKVDQSKTTVTITLDFAQSDKDKADHDLGLRKDAAPTDEQSAGHEIVHADIFNSNPDGQLGKSLEQKEKDAAPGTADLNGEKKGDKKAAEKRVDEILKPKDKNQQ